MAIGQNHSRTIGVFFGSMSAEHDQSIATATRVLKELGSMGFNTVAIYLDINGVWQVVKIYPQFKQSVSQQVKSLVENPLTKRWSLQLNHDQGVVFSAPQRFFGRSEITIDIAFPVFHGLSGEDGTFQGLCDLLRIPYIGCGLATSALGLDKVLAKDVLQSFGIPTKNYVYFSAVEWRTHQDSLVNAVINDLSLPVFVKPARLGGGIGISCIETINDIETAVEEAFSYDTKVLVEEAVIEPTEIIVSVLGNYFRPNYIQVSEPLYRNKTNAAFQSISIPQKDTSDIKQLATKVFSAFEGTGLAQIDILKDPKTNQLYVTEIDTMPYNLSLPLWEASNVSADSVLRELVRLADENFKRN